ncbi:MAG: DUF4388 domain-containing protein, partial [Chloroflexi bacterium]
MLAVPRRLPVADEEKARGRRTSGKRELRRLRARWSDLDAYTNFLLDPDRARPISGERPLQSHGTLAETPLRSLLESAQGERSTGTLTVRNGNGQSTSLYFLFGHLFHAQGDGKSGDDAVVNALHWTKGDFEFDAKAKLPADETVKAGIPELVNTVVAEPKQAPAHAEPK